MKARSEVKAKVNASWRKYRENNLEKVKERFDDWKERNKDSYRESRTIFQREKRRNNPVFRMQQNLRRRLHWAVTHQETTKDETTMKLVGCDLENLVDYLESNFQENMSWENYGEWHVDHVRPCNSFDLSDEGQQQVCFNWRNLLPLWGEENQIKADRYEPNDETEWVEIMLGLGYEGELFLKFEEGNSY